MKKLAALIAVMLALSGGAFGIQAQSPYTGNSSGAAPATMNPSGQAPEVTYPEDTMKSAVPDRRIIKKEEQGNLVQTEGASRCQQDCSCNVVVLSRDQTEVVSQAYNADPTDKDEVIIAKAYHEKLQSKNLAVRFDVRSPITKEAELECMKKPWTITGGVLPGDPGIRNEPGFEGAISCR